MECMKPHSLPVPLRINTGHTTCLCQGQVVLYGLYQLASIMVQLAHIQVLAPTSSKIQHIQATGLFSNFLRQYMLHPLK